MYRVGFPGWKLAGRLGLPLRIRVYAHYDKESRTFWANSPDLDGLAVSGETLDELRREALAATETLLELAVNSQPPRTVAELRVTDSVTCPA